MLVNVDSPILVRAEEASPEMKAYYANRPLMWRNLTMILVLNLGWSMCFTIIGPLMQLRMNIFNPWDKGHLLVSQLVVRL